MAGRATVSFHDAGPVEIVAPAAIRIGSRAACCSSWIATVMLDPEDVASRMPLWLRAVLVGVVVVLATGGGLYAYRYFTMPRTLTVAVGSVDGEAARILSAIASRLTSTNAHIRLKVVDTATALGAAKEFSAGKADLAIVRADVGNLSAARTVVLVTYGVALIVVPPGAGIASVDDLKGKVVGVVAEDNNHRLVEALAREYDLARAKVRFRDVPFGEAARVMQSRQVSALLVVIPISDKYLALVRNFFAGGGKQKAGVIPIESAGAIASMSRAYESYDLPKGTLRGSPPIPDDDMTTLRVPFYLVADKNLADDDVADLAKAVMEARRELLAEFPLLAQIAAPSTEKDAFIPIHPGAAAYFDGEQKDFFDRYGNALYYGPMLLGALASLAAAAWKFLGAGGSGGSGKSFGPLYALPERIRAAGSDAELASIEDEIDTIVKAELARYAKGQSPAMDAAALGLAVQRLQRLIDYRRGRLAGATTETAPT